jgi:hypothetical protein
MPRLLLAFACIASLSALTADEIRDEFLRVADGLKNSSNSFLGERQIESLGGYLKQSNLTAGDRAKARTVLGRHFLRFGRIAEAKAVLDASLSEVATLPSAAGSILHFNRGLAALREAEIANCVRNHNRECCIFPLAGGGIHTLPGAATEAMDHFESALELDPKNADAMWLLNIAAMAAKKYPSGVPELFRIPEQSLESEATIGTFVDIAGPLGVDAFNLCGGVVVDDFDRDGFLDIVTSTSDPSGPMTFYRNTGTGQFADVTGGSGLENQLGGLNCVGADYDNDGDTDILVLRGAWLGKNGEIRNSLLRNNGKDRAGKVSFTDVTRKTGLADKKFPTQAAAWGDFDNDGDLDLYVSNESRPTHGQNYPCQLFRNNGDETFTDIARQAGVTNDQFSKGVTVGDYDNDGDLDIFVSNVGKCRLYQNDGSAKFVDVATEAGVIGEPGYNFAPWFFDFNNDGWLDIFICGYVAKLSDFMLDAKGEPHKAALPHLYINQKDGTFVDIAKQAGLDHAWLPMGANYGDIDNDGWLDVYFATGDPRLEILVPNILLKNNEGKRFLNATFGSGLGHLQKGHGVAFADFDHDGDQDLYNQLGGFYPNDKFRNAFFLNPGNENHFLELELVGTESNRDGIGTRITVEIRTPDGGGRKIHRAVGSLSSFGGSPLGRQEIGLGNAASIGKLTIRWPAGDTTSFEDTPLDSRLQITEGSAEFTRLNRERIDFSPATR